MGEALSVRLSFMGPAVYTGMCLGSFLQEWEGAGKKQSGLSFIECSVRWSHCNSIQTAQPGVGRGLLFSSM